MNNYYFETFKKALENPEVTVESIASLMDNTDFFFKVLRVKFESKDPEMQRQAIEELSAFRDFLEKNTKRKS